MPRRYTDAEVEARMVPQIVEAIYPLLIPVEQQDMRIQASNHAHMTEIATVVWRFFSVGDERNRRMVRDAMGLAHGQSVAPEGK